MRDNKIYTIVVQALISAIYVVLTVTNVSFSYGAIQFRVSEALTQLVVFNKKFWLPITLGVAIANFFSPLGLVDVFFGTLGTGLALAISIYIFKFIKNRLLRHVLNIIVYLVLCMPIIAFEITIFGGENGSRTPFEWSVFISIYSSLLLSQTLVMGLGAILTEVLNRFVNLEKLFDRK